jgi:hypothetical protein
VKTWVVYAALTVISWGVWGVFSKVASAHSKPRQVLIFQSVGVLAFGLVVLAVEKFNIEWSATAFSWAAAGGFLVFIGFLTFLRRWMADRLRRSSCYPRFIRLLPSRSAFFFCTKDSP